MPTENENEQNNITIAITEDPTQIQKLNFYDIQHQLISQLSKIKHVVAAGDEEDENE